MTALYYSPCIVYGGTRYWLPPNVVPSFDPQQSVESIPIKQTSTNILASVRANLGTRIQLGVQGIKTTRDQATVNAWIQEILAALKEQEFDLYIFSDHCWKGCALESAHYEYPLPGYGWLDNMSLTLFCPNFEADFSTPLAYDPDYATEYPYAHLVGRPTGDAYDTPSQPPITGEPAMQTHCGIFTGGIEAVTASGAEHRITIGGRTGSKWLLKGVQVTNAQNGSATGTTTLRASIAGVGSSTSQINATVASGSRFGSEATGSITMTAGDTLYLYITGAGGHQNVQYRVRLQNTVT